MKLQATSKQNFGKLYINKLIKDQLADEAAHAINIGECTTFQDKLKACQISDKFEITVNPQCVTYVNKETNERKDFKLKNYDEDSDTKLFQVLNIAMNYAFIKSNNLFRE